MVRVDGIHDIDAMVMQLRADGVEVEVDVDSEMYPDGRFAQLADPEGNPIQLWEPKEFGRLDDRRTGVRQSS